MNMVYIAENVFINCVLLHNYLACYCTMIQVILGPPAPKSKQIYLAHGENNEHHLGMDCLKLLSDAIG